MCGRALPCLFSSVRSLSKIEFLALKGSGQKKTAEASAPVASRKRVQRYGKFLNWQNIWGSFFKFFEYFLFSGYQRQLF
jgi:hypothetical protein